MKFSILFYFTSWVLTVPGFAYIDQNQKDVRYIEMNLALYVTFDKQKFSI